MPAPESTYRRPNAMLSEVGSAATTAQAAAEMHNLDLEDRSSYLHPKLTCDLIMKGGITSGVVYPRAACRLATRYQFKQLGGASAGAIAAALTAAAEYHRQQQIQLPASRNSESSRRAGFVRLHNIPTELGLSLPDLFQPMKSTRAAHSILMTAVAPGR